MLLAVVVSARTPHLSSISDRCSSPVPLIRSHNLPPFHAAHRAPCGVSGEPTRRGSGGMMRRGGRRRRVRRRSGASPRTRGASCRFRCPKIFLRGGKQNKAAFRGCFSVIVRFRERAFPLQAALAALREELDSAEQALLLRGGHSAALGARADHPTRPPFHGATSTQSPPEPPHRLGAPPPARASAPRGGRTGRRGAAAAPGGCRAHGDTVRAHAHSARARG